MRVGLVSPLPPQHGGVATIAGWLLANQEAVGASYVTFDLTRPTDELGGRLRISSIVHQILQLSQFVLWVRRSPRVVHYALAPSLTGLLRDFTYIALLGIHKRKVIVHVHTVTPLRMWWGPVMRLARRLAAEMVVLGTPAQRELRSAGVDSRIVPNAVPFGVELIGAYDHLKESQPFRVLFVGALGASKGCFELLDALASVRASGIDCHVDFVGSPAFRGERERLDARVAALGLHSAVRFLGPREPSELPGLYARSHAFCLPSHLEGLPLALVEAMAYGIPAVATPVGCVEDLVIDDETGLLVKAGDTLSLAQAMSRLARDRGLRQRLGRNGSAHVAARMGSDVVASAWRDTYSSLDVPRAGANSGVDPLSRTVVGFSR
jgi:glycosyltransferase involved in cell wall biosynthesis